MFQYESVYKEKEKHIDLNKIFKKNFLACVNENPLSPSLTHKNFKGGGGLQMLETQNTNRQMTY